MRSVRQKDKYQITLQREGRHTVLGSRIVRRRHGHRARETRQRKRAAEKEVIRRPQVRAGRKGWRLEQKRRKQQGAGRSVQ